MSTGPNAPDPTQLPAGGQPTRVFPTDPATGLPVDPTLPPAEPPPWEAPVSPYAPTAVNPAVGGGPPAYVDPNAPPPDPTAIYGTGGSPPSPPPMTYQPTGGSGPLLWIIGGVAALALLGLIAIFVAGGNRGTSTPTPTSLPALEMTATALPTNTPVVIVVTDTPGPPPATVVSTDTPAAPPPTATATATLLPTVTPIPDLPTVTPLPPTPPPAPTDTPGSTDTPAPTATPVPPTATPPPSATELPGGVKATPTSVPDSGPLPPADVMPVAATVGKLTIQWFGQACFLIVGGEGPRILIDPVGPQLGYNLPFFDKLDALLISHLHPDHTYTRVVPGGVPNLVGLGADGHFTAIQQDVGRAAVRDVAAFHDNNTGRDRGENALWVIDIDGFHIVHLGDLGQTQLTPDQVQALGKPDILMIPVGGNFTIAGLQARAIVQQLTPTLVIPMHYRTDRTPSDLGLAPLDDFLGSPPPANAPNVVTLQKSDLAGKKTEVLLMNYK